MVARLSGLAVAAAVSSAALSGCYSFHVASSQSFSRCALATEGGCVPVELVLAQNDGWFLFDRIPVVCGNPDVDSWFPWRFFSDETDMARVQDPIVARARARGARIVQMAAVNDNATLMPVPGVEGLSIPYILCHHETQISALLVVDAADGGEEGQ